MGEIFFRDPQLRYFYFRDLWIYAAYSPCSVKIPKLSCDQENPYFCESWSWFFIFCDLWWNPPFFSLHTLVSYTRLSLVRDFISPAESLVPSHIKSCNGVRASYRNLNTSVDWLIFSLVYKVNIRDVFCLQNTHNKSCIGFDLKVLAARACTFQ